MSAHSLLYVQAQPEGAPDSLFHSASTISGPQLQYHAEGETGLFQWARALTDCMHGGCAHLYTEANKLLCFDFEHRVTYMY